MSDSKAAPESHATAITATEDTRPGWLDRQSVDVEQESPIGGLWSPGNG